MLPTPPVTSAGPSLSGAHSGPLPGPALAAFPPLVPADLDALVALTSGRRLVALTGAGLSTESGIPDYRGPETRRRARQPVQYNAFVGDAAARARYWARSAMGWPRFTAARPNAGHAALARLEAAGLLAGTITQNVDRLHHAAGARNVVELHGALGDVRCLGCARVVPRADVQTDLVARNPALAARITGPAALAPDGDADLPDAALDGFVVPACACGGALKPDVVFFGECVPPARVEAAWTLFAEADVLLVAGSSLAVFSGYRFVLAAARAGVPVALLTHGPTRADASAAIKVEAPLGTVLPALAGRLLGA